MNQQKRKICFIITNRVHYARQKLLLKLLQNNLEVELQLLVGGSAVLSKYTNTLEYFEKEKFPIIERLLMVVEGGNDLAMTKTTGLAILEFSNAFQRLRPDLVVIRGDRFEMLAAALSAAFLNIPIAHIEGGDVSGTIDESVRHAITKLSHIHFVTNEESRRRVLQMGEHPDFVFDVGSPDVEYAATFMKNEYDLKKTEERVNNFGTGGQLSLSGKYLIVLQHPVSTETDNGRKMKETVAAVASMNTPTVWFWPNIDAGTDEISKVLRVFKDNYNQSNIRFIRDMEPEDFIPLLKNCACLVGNSSAGIKESSYFGIPVVNIGTRQNNRLRAENIMDVGHNRNEIKVAIIKQMNRNRYPSSNLYFKPDTSKNVAKILLTSKPPIQKTFYVQK